ncbi:hypothetical protein [Halorussus halobius]|uniref:hypothetical protein n=1 Tax=Halorussus halobius TaxID=1710537 RepID=UPI00109294CB|nr:hypothetical protein [Halorussus halobius]
MTEIDCPFDNCNSTLTFLFNVTVAGPGPNQDWKEVKQCTGCGNMVGADDQSDMFASGLGKSKRDHQATAKNLKEY